MGANTKLVEAIGRDPKFQQLVTRRTRFAWALTAAMLIIYLVYIALVAFAPQWLAISIEGVITLGIPVGLFVIVAAFALTAFYVYRANNEYDEITRQIIEKVK